jgi:uncharacterized repeat protein (TIGR01451 family)
MKKFRLFAATSVAATVVALALGGTVLAWHPQGKIVKTVQDTTTNSAVSTATDTSSALSVAPGDTLMYTVTVSNVAQPAANNDNDMANTVMTDTLPSGVELVSNPSQRKITENIGTIAPGKSVTKQYTVTVTDKTDGDVITNKACFTGNSLANDNPQSGCSTVVVKIHIPPTPVFTCDQLSVSQGASRTATITALNTTAKNGATFKDAVISWGDNSADLTTQNAAGQNHQYAADGTYTVTATAHFMVSDSEKTATSAACTAKVSFATTPPELPNTGAGDAILPALLTGIVGYGLYLFNAKRRAV